MGIITKKEITTKDAIFIFSLILVMIGTSVIGFKMDPIFPVLMALTVLYDRFSSRVTPVELEKAKTEIYTRMSELYPSKTSFDDVKEKIDKIYDIIIKKANL